MKNKGRSARAFSIYLIITRCVFVCVSVCVCLVLLIFFFLGGDDDVDDTRCRLQSQNSHSPNSTLYGDDNQQSIVVNIIRRWRYNEFSIFFQFFEREKSTKKKERTGEMHWFKTIQLKNMTHFTIK